MPTQVRGADGRVIMKETNDGDATQLARQVHANTGEVVTLVPFIDKHGEWVLDEANARTFGAPQVEETVLADEITDDELDALKVKDLKALAEREQVDLGDATKKDDIVEAIKDARSAKATASTFDQK
jgi:hypothetical protein